jgi:lysophospholipase L1-like esterase
MRCSREGSGPEPRRWRRNLGFALLGAVVGLGVVEGALQWMAPPFTQFVVHPPGLTRQFRPLPEIMPGIAHPARVTFNSLGLRGREPDFAAPRERLEILAIGGSTTECLYLDDAATWPALVEQILARRRGESVWVGNAGISGASTRENILHVKHLLPQDPRIHVVVALLGVNDLTIRLSAGTEYRSTTVPGEAATEIRRAFARVPGRFYEASTEYLAPVTAAWYKKTAVYQLLKRVREFSESVMASRGIRQDEAGRIYEVWREHRRTARVIKDQLPDLTPALEEYALNLHTIIDLVERAGARPVLMTQPTLWRPDLEPAGERLLWLGGEGRFQQEPGHAYYSVRALARAMASYNRRLLEVCAARGIFCIDLAGEIPATLEMFYDDAHFTEKGAQRVARVVSEHLMRMDATGQMASRPESAPVRR